MGKYNKITAWSFSRFGDYLKCPALALYKHVMKIKEPSSPALDNGSRVHDAAAAYLRGKLRALPKDFKLFKKDMAALKKIGAVAEAEWAFTAEWEPCGWFDNTTWLRAKVDAFYLDSTGVLHVRDYKTGKEHLEEHARQRELYAIGAFLMYPQALTVRAEHWYLDTGRRAPSDFNRPALPALQKAWIKNTKAMLTDTTFKPTPGRQCQWCFFSASKNGPCKY